MHNHEVPPTRMEHHATRIELSVPELTSPLHVAQCEKVHPRYPISLRDNEKNNHAAGAICTSDDQHADLSGIRTDTNHAVLMSRRQSAETHTGVPGLARATVAVGLARAALVRARAEHAEHAAARRANNP